MITYLHLQEKKELPEIDHFEAFRAIILIEEDVSSDWQRKVSQWLVKSKCLYMLAWGINCSSWDDTVDEASLVKWSFNEIPDENFIMTTWHENDSVQEVFWFAKNCAHPYKDELEINQSLILHISLESQKERLLNLFLEA